MATAGLAVSLLTQSVWEVVISGTQRQCDIETWKEQEVTDKPTVKKKGTNQQISQSFVCSVLQYQYFPSVSWESACVTPTPAPQSLRSQMSHSPEPLSILVMRCVGDTHKHSHTNQLREFQRAVSLDTRYSWCLSGGSNQTYWAALLPLMASSNTVTYLANPHERTGSQHRRALLQSRGSYQQKSQTNFHSQMLTGDILCQSALGNISLYILFFHRTSEDCNLTFLCLLALSRDQDVTSLGTTCTAVNFCALSLTKMTPHQQCSLLVNYW